MKSEKKLLKKKTIYKSYDREQMCAEMSHWAFMESFWDKQQFEANT